MKRMLLALMCAAPLVSGYTLEEPQAIAPQETVASAGVVCLASMGCELPGCTDPAHYHSCPVDCVDPAHYHNCPVGCADPSHPYCGWNWGEIPETEPEFWTSMGCDQTDCTDPTHYHHCVADCAEPTHYHDCPVACADPTHPHCNQCWEDAPRAGAEFWTSMGCDRTDCTDPAHYHHCAAGCTDPAHYHDCPLGCQSMAHGHGGVYHQGRRGHHGRRHH